MSYSPQVFFANSLRTCLNFINLALFPFIKFLCIKHYTSLNFTYYKFGLLNLYHANLNCLLL